MRDEGIERRRRTGGGQIVEVAELEGDLEVGPGVLGGQDDEFIRKLCEKIPLRRMAEARDQAGVICFLASSDADFVTGVTIDVTGGL